MTVFCFLLSRAEQCLRDAEAAVISSLGRFLEWLRDLTPWKVSMIVEALVWYL